MVALQQMFATTQAGEFAALREAAQLKVENAALKAELNKLKTQVKSSDTPLK